MGLFISLHRLLNRKPGFYLGILFVLTQAILFLYNGVEMAFEGAKYVEEGTTLFQTGGLGEPKYIFYLPVILLVAVCRFLSISPEWVALVNVIVAACAARCFYLLSEILTGSKSSVAFYCTAALVLFFPLQKWNFFLYSDSLFISFSIIFCWLVAKAAPKGLTGTIWILFGLLVLIVSRPHGLLFIPPVVIYLVFRKQSKTLRLANIGLCIALFVGMYLLLNRAFTGGGDMDAMKPFVEEHIICFVPQAPDGADVNVQKTGNPVNDIFYYILHNPLHFLKLMVLRLYSFFDMTRPYYSTLHNIYLLAFMIPVYILALFGMRKMWRIRPLAFYILSLLMLYPLGATFQCDDWHSRFTMVVFPWLLLIAGLNGRKNAAVANPG